MNATRLGGTSTSSSASSSWSVVGFCALLGLNATFLTLFVTWFIADAAAINQAESESGFDPSSLLPNANLMWVAAYGSLILLLVVDTCAVAMLRASTRAPRRSAFGPTS